MHIYEGYQLSLAYLIFLLVPGSFASGLPRQIRFPSTFKSAYFKELAPIAGPESESSKKAFSCHLCRYSVDRADSLSRHMKLHTGDLYVCGECGTRYNSKYNLKKHQQKKHGKM